jgi:aminopeptidase N
MARAERVIGGVILALSSACAAQIDARSARMDLAGGVPFDVEHYAITLDIDPVRRVIEADCTIRLWPARESPHPSDARDEPLTAIELSFDGFDIRSVSDSTGRALSWTRDGDRLDVQLATPLERDEFAEITVHYGGRPRAGLWFAGERDGVPTQVYTQGECTEARSWFPCRDHPSDRATTDLCVTMPETWTSVAAGEMVERAQHGRRVTEHWRMAVPHPSYLVTLVAGELTVEHGEWEDLPLLFVCAPERAAFLRETFAETDEILAFFSAVTGVRYPYAKYAQSCVDNFPLGGMENVSATTLTDAVLPDEEGLSEASPRELIAHEAAHQWFGDLVTCEEWSDAWLNEGFATYFAALYEEHAEGREAFESMMRGIRAVYLARDVGTNRRPISMRGRGLSLAGFFTGHVYQGGATRLHYLRGLLGDDAFFAGVRRYLARHRGDSVRTEDLRLAFEEVSGRDLRAFFQQWIRGVGHPAVKSSWSYDAAAGRVELTLEQTARESEQPSPIFDFEVDVEIATASGAAVRRVRLDRRRGTFELACDGEPSWVRVDPRDWVPMELSERMPAQCWVALAAQGDLSGRLRALGVLSLARAGDLKANETDVVEELFLKLAAEDEDPAVRLTALAALARSVAPGRRGAARELFLYAARHDASHDVRIAAFTALRTCGRDSEVHAFAESELARNEGWNLRAEIVGVLATSAPDQAFETLSRALETRSAHGEFEARILAEMIATQDPRARAVLLAWLRDDARPDIARAVALRELTRSRLRHGELEAVIDLLASPRIRLRRDALAALATSDDARARTAIERHRATRPSAIELLTADEALEELPQDP